VVGGAKPVPFNPNRVKYDEWGAALVALAGPLTNFVIAFLVFGLYVLAGTPSTGVAKDILVTGVWVNLGFFVFNMLPIPPLDGSRVLYALAPEFARRIMETIEQYGLIVIFAIVMLASPLIGTYMGGTINLILQGFYKVFGG
jgi:Zn-dependent protease